MYKHAPKLMLVTALIALAAAGIFYARSSVRKSSPQSVSPTIRPHDTHTAEGIEGRVIDFEGQPIANAKVYADRDDVITLRLMSAISDEAGNFRIDVPEPGIYKVFGSKLEDGYPLTISGFHQEVKI